MKKTLIAIGLLSVFGAAQAESSVTLYGNINVAVTKKGDSGVTLKAQEYRYASHIGFTGKEDLGNGYSAIFKLESELEPDTGSGTYGSDKKQFGFNRHSYVGLVTPFGAFRLGRSTTPIVNMWIGGNFAEGRGIGEFTGGLAGSGLRSTQPEASQRWNNALFYDVKKGGFTAGFAVTTKGSQSVVPTRSETLFAADGVTPIAAATAPVNNEGVKNLNQLMVHMHATKASLVCGVTKWGQLTKWTTAALIRPPATLKMHLLKANELGWWVQA